MIQFFIFAGAAYVLYDLWANTYVVRDRKTGKRVKGSGYYYVGGTSKRRRHRRYR